MKKKPRRALLNIFDGDSSYGFTPERDLWTAVLTQAIMDAVSKSNDGERLVARFYAREWLNNKKSIDFLLVCEYASLDPERARKKAQIILDRGYWQIRAAPGKGKRYLEQKRRKLEQMEPA